MPRVKPILSEGDIVLKIKRWWWPFGWSNYARYSSRINSIDAKLLKKRKEIEDLLIERQRAVADFDAELEEVRMLGVSQYGEGEEFDMSWKDLEKRFPEPTLPPVDIGELKAFLNPHFCHKYELGKSKEHEHRNKHNHQRKGLSKTNPPFEFEKHNGQGVSSYTLEDFAKTNPDAIPFKEHKDKQNNSSNNKTGRKQRLHELRRENPQDDDESQGEWDKRINRMLADEGYGNH